MQWRCNECGRAEYKRKVVVDAVCHHCGKTLCRSHQIEITDDAFDKDSGMGSYRAVHCHDCRRRYHPIIFQTAPRR